ncbi:hypothetical protein GQ457_08G027270 [Hibiscus cannabinus]
MEPDEDIKKMFDRFSVIVNGIKGYGEIIPEDKLVRKLIYSLPESWDSKKIAIIEAKNLKTLKLDELMGSLLTHGLMKQGKRDEEKKKEEKKEIEKKKKIGIALKASLESDSSEEDDKEMAFLAKRFTRHVRTECPQLKKKSFGKKKKLKAHVATWSDEESSDEDEEEVANLCLMALDDEPKQDTVIDSTIEAEYITASEATKESIWIKKFITKLGVVSSISDAVELRYDKNGAIMQAKEPKSHQRSKHILRLFNLIREIIDRGDVKICKVHTDDNIVDPLMNPLAQQKHERHTESLDIKYVIDWS